MPAAKNSTKGARPRSKIEGFVAHKLKLPPRPRQIIVKQKYRLKGKPVVVSFHIPVKDKQAYFCHISTKGLPKTVRLPGSFGVNPLQALVLALFLANNDLLKFGEDLRIDYGGRHRGEPGHTGIPMFLLFANEFSRADQKKIKLLHNHLLNKHFKNLRRRRINEMKRAKN